MAIIGDHHPYEGLGKYTVRLYENLENEIDHLKYYYMRYSIRDWHPNSLKPKPLPYINTIDVLPFHSPLKTLGFIKANLFQKYTFPKGYDVYHATHPMLAGFIPKDSKWVATVHDIQPIDMPEEYFILFRTQFKALIHKMRNATKLIVVSQTMKSRLSRLLNISENNMSIIYHGADLDTFKPGKPNRKLLGLPEDKKLILHVGGDSKKKDVITLMKMFAKLRKTIPNSVFVNIGNLSPQIIELSKKLGINDHLINKRGLSEVEMSYLYRSVDMFASATPHQYSYSMLPTLEAMSSGCPIMVSSNDEGNEYVGDGALIMPLGDVDSWVESAQLLLTDDEFRYKQIEAGLSQSKKRSWAIAAKQTLKVYQSASLM